MNIYSATVTLFLIIDPLGNIPIFLAILKRIESKRRATIILRESLIAFLILTLFLFSGKTILQSFNISVHALSVAGGIILFIVAIKLVFPPDVAKHAAEQNITEPFIVPLAIPLLAGPAAMATVILWATQEPHQMSQWFIALACSSILSTMTLLFAIPLRALCGDKLLVALEQLMGMLLTAIAVQMVINGLSAV